MNDRDLLRIAWICWAVPAITGVGSTILSATTGEFFFAWLGLLCIPVGVGLFLLGVAMLAAAKSSPRGLILALLLGNFPLAFICACVGIATTPAFRGDYRLEVSVANDSDAVIDSAVVTYGEYSAKAESIPPHATERVKLKVGYLLAQTQVNLTVRRGGNTLQKTLCTFDGDDLHGEGVNHVAAEVSANEIKRRR